MIISYFSLHPWSVTSDSDVCLGRTRAVITAARKSAEPKTANGVVYPPTEYKAPPNVGPTISPSPKKVSNEAYK